MDKLQIQHAIDQIELHATDLKNFLTSGGVDKIEDLEDEIRDLEDEIERLEGEAAESFDLQNKIDKAIELIEDLQTNEHDSLTDKTKLLEIIKTLS